MATVGNNSTATASHNLGPISVPFTAPFDGSLANVSAYVIIGTNNGGTFSLMGQSQLILPGDPSYTNFTVSSNGAVGAAFRTGNAGALTFSGGGVSSMEINGDASNNWDIWGDFEPAPVPGTPNTAPTITPLSMTTWQVTCFPSSNSSPAVNILSSYVVERSADGGTTWSVAGTVPLTGNLSASFTDTVAAGSLQYRYRAANTTGQSAPSPVSVAAAPSAPPAATITPLSLGSWSVLLPALLPNAVQMQLERSQDGGTTWLVVYTGGQTTFTDGVSAGPLEYRVLNENSVGQAISPVTVAPAPGTPPAPAITPQTMTTWNVVVSSTANAVQTALQRSQDGGTTWTTVYTGGATTYTDTVAAGALAYRQIAQNSVGNATSAVTTAPLPTAPVAPPVYSEVLD